MIMTKKKNATVVELLAASLLLILRMICTSAELEVGFYQSRCGTHDVEDVIRGLVSTAATKDPTIIPALIRMQFHDCFVMGCDGSVLLDGEQSEKAAPANSRLRGFELIDAAKDALESLCPGVVSCADIIAAATRDAIALGGGEAFEVQTGRRDGSISQADKVDIPGPRTPLESSIRVFRKKGLDVHDMVVLLGGHTVGKAHCSFFVDRLYEFNGTRMPDPSMEPNLLAVLQLRCPLDATTDNAVDLDQNGPSAGVLDASYFSQILSGRGVLQIDQALALHPVTGPIAASLALASDDDFGKLFAQSMVRMGAVDVLTGEQGEIRRRCRATNAADA